MREMKDSGVEWIGEIPSHWKVNKINRLFSNIGSGTTPKATEEGYFEGTVNWIQSGDINGGYIETCKNKITEKACNTYSVLKVYRSPFIIVAMYGASVGNISISKIDGCVNQACCVMSKSNENFLFLYYAIRSAKGFLIYKAEGGGQPNISQDKIKNLWMPIPPLPEQRAIATYLDAKCAEIDSLISLQEEMISELQAYKQSVITEAVTHGLNPNVTMKDSGVEWIGKIPEEWKILRLKNIAKVNGRVGFRGYKTEDLVGEGEGAYTIGGKHISSCKLDLSNADYISWDKYYESPEIMVKKGDIVLAQRGALGKVALIETQIGKATINPSLVLLNNIVGNVKFLYNYLLSDFILTTIALLNTSTAVPMITQKQIENLKVLVPPLPEQQQIAAYLDTKCAEIDSLITIKQQKIDDLKEYKKSIIFEYVTGKKIVPTNIENN